MPNEVRTIEELLALFADNENGDISEQDARDFIVTMEAMVNARLATSLVSSFSVSIFDSVDAEEWRLALGLGAAAVRDVGTTLGTVAAGDHTHTGLSVQAAGTPSVRALGTSSTEAAAGDHTHTGYISKGTDGSGSNSAGTPTAIASQIPTGNAAAGKSTLGTTLVGSSGGTPQTPYVAIETAGGVTNFFGPNSAGTGTVQIASITGIALSGNILGRINVGAGGTGLAHTAGNDLQGYRNNALIWESSGFNFRLTSNCLFQWAASAWAGTVNLPSPDVGLSRNASGILEVNSGTAGTLRDLTLRDLIATRAVRLASFTVAALPAAGTAGRTAYASNGRRSGEGAGAGTGCPVWDDGTNWKTFYDNATVQA